MVDPRKMRRKGERELEARQDRVSRSPPRAPTHACAHIDFDARCPMCDPDRMLVAAPAKERPPLRRPHGCFACRPRMRSDPKVASPWPLSDSLSFCCECILGRSVCPSVRQSVRPSANVCQNMSVNVCLSKHVSQPVGRRPHGDHGAPWRPHRERRRTATPWRLRRAWPLYSQCVVFHLAPRARHTYLRAQLLGKRRSHGQLHIPYASQVQGSTWLMAQFNVGAAQNCGPIGDPMRIRTPVGNGGGSGDLVQTPSP